MQSADPISRMITELSKLPGIGEKTATRLAFTLLKWDEDKVRALSESILSARLSVKFCRQCLNYTESDVCQICQNASRHNGVICVVEKPTDVVAIENSGRFFGTYHVLHGVLSPLDGIGPSQLHIRELLQRLETHQVKEVVLALNSSVESDATGVYLTKLIKPLGIGVSKIAYGIPVGGVLEFMDRQTIGRAMENRVVSSS
jgi:recombination protein RecR